MLFIPVFVHYTVNKLLFNIVDMPYENVEVFVESDIINHRSLEGIITCQLTYIMIVKHRTYLRKNGL